VVNQAKVELKTQALSQSIVAPVKSVQQKVVPLSEDKIAVLVKSVPINIIPKDVKEGKVNGVFDIPLKGPDARVILICHKDDPKTYEAHGVKVQWGRESEQCSLLMPWHTYKIMNNVFYLKSHTGSVLVDKTKVNVMLHYLDDDDKDVLELKGLNLGPLNVRAYKEAEIKEGQIRVIKHTHQHDCCVTSVTSDYQKRYEYDGRLFYKANSEGGTCGSAIIDSEEHLVGVHGGKNDEWNYMYLIPWASIKTSNGISLDF
jgi:hypothetical protein